MRQKRDEKHSAEGRGDITWREQASWRRWHLNKGVKEGGKHTNVWGKSIPGRGHSKCKGPETGVCLAYLRNIKEASLAGTV